MRAGNASRLVLYAAVPSLLFGLGCSKEVKADFPRPPATASMPVGADGDDAVETPEPSPVLPDELPEPQSVLDPAPEPEPQPPPPRRTQPPSDSEPEPAPAPEPASTQLARSSSNGSVRPDPALVSKLRRASMLLGSIEHRTLSSSQEEQFMAARGFVAQARKALNEGDDRRALVLIDKGLILAEDVERSSRP